MSYPRLPIDQSGSSGERGQLRFMGPFDPDLGGADMSIDMPDGVVVDRGARCMPHTENLDLVAVGHACDLQGDVFGLIAGQRFILRGLASSIGNKDVVFSERWLRQGDAGPAIVGQGKQRDHHDGTHQRG